MSTGPVGGSSNKPVDTQQLPDTTGVKQKKGDPFFDFAVDVFVRNLSDAEKSPDGSYRPSLESPASSPTGTVDIGQIMALLHEAGNTLYSDPGCRIGHLEEMITVFDSEMKLTRVYPKEWEDFAENTIG